ncbi:hypothetical protein [Fangia hongkongensis]|uniref:hypothetical protein n=1 Tax=Fangia hongkongensis TaxID=270495 RepID=UPI00037F8575|nr:hypothetical protein [Fangia hongkongensis]MBK2124557.1 hypothetical protein [Fangia hongkongensis]
MYKEYSTLFATKLGYITDICAVSSSYTGKIPAIENKINEKDTTIKNWLFNAKLPRKPKRIQIADALGVSEEYLFDDSIDVQDVRAPEIYQSEECYYIPFIQRDNVFSFESNRPQVVERRLPVMLPIMAELVEKYGKYIFATQIKNSAEAHNSGVLTAIYTKHSKYQAFQLLISPDKKGLPALRKVIEDDDGLLKLQYFEAEEERLEYINPENPHWLVLFSFQQSLP